MLKRLLATFVVLTHVCACTTLAKYPQDGSSPAFAYRAGEELRLQTPEGARELTVALVTDEEVCGTDTCFRVDEISGVERKELSYWKTAGLVLGIGLTAAVLAVAASGMAFFPPMVFVP